MSRPDPPDPAAGRSGAADSPVAGGRPAPGLLRRSAAGAGKAGVAAALLAGAGSAAWSWVAGPAQVFRPPGGARWDRLLETALSWALPTLLWVAAVVFLARLALGALRRR